MNNSIKSLSVLGLVFLLGIGTAGEAYGGKQINLDFDVAQDGNTFKVIALDDAFPPFDTLDDIDFEEVHPGQGAVFSVLGFIYPAGTLQGGAVSGTDVNGNPAFPELVLGSWNCRGWFIQSGLPGTTGIQLLGTQVWLFDAYHSEFGGQTIVTDGIDLSIEEVDLDVPFKRAIIGGTGQFNGAIGEQTMTNFGFNDSFGFDSTHTLKFSTHKLKGRKR